MSGGESRTAPDRDRSPLLSEFGVSGRHGNTNILVSDTEDVCRYNDSGLFEKNEKEQFGKPMQPLEQFFPGKNISRLGQSVRCNVILVLIVALLVLLVCGVGSVVYSMQLMKSNMQDMQREHVKLQDRVAKLEKECRQEKWQDSDGGKVFRRPGDDADAGDADLSMPAYLGSHLQHPQQGSDDLSHEDVDNQEDNYEDDDDAGNADDDDDDDDDSKIDEEDATSDGKDSSITPHKLNKRSASVSNNKKKKDKKPPSQNDGTNGNGKGNGGKFCKRVQKCISDPSSHKDCPKIQKCIPAPSTPEPFRIKAVHFMSKFWSDEGGKMSRNDFGQKSCLFMDDWKGLACRNRTVRIPYNQTPLKMLQPADWMTKLYPSPADQPLVSDNNGGYSVQESGLYLIYSSVLYHDVKHRQSQAVVVNGTKLFKCMDSVDYIDEDLPPDASQAKYKTCAMTGVTHLIKGDRLELQNLYANTEIDLSKDATFFGAVLLASSS